MALEWIGQYLKGTLDKGLLLLPTTLGPTFPTDVYVDADFAGSWGYEDPNNPVSVKSRTVLKPTSQHPQWKPNTRLRILLFVRQFLSWM
jgi:hypothetical protein